MVQHTVYALSYAILNSFLLFRIGRTGPTFLHCDLIAQHKLVKNGGKSFTLGPVLTHRGQANELFQEEVSISEASLFENNVL
jgi:hypothetical protein